MIDFLYSTTTVLTVLERKSREISPLFRKTMKILNTILLSCSFERLSSGLRRPAFNVAHTF